MTKRQGPKIRTEFSHKIKVEETAWIPLADGTRLAARIWMPEDAETNPVPVILEYVPYRRRDGTRLRDDPMHGWFAGHGYASVRVDIRGTGDSDGLLDDEYLKLEQDDALEIIAWLAAQPWSTGRVGMMGISWGGFNALQVAARRPPALKAIVTACSTDDRYNDDIHYMGGCVLGDNFSWASTFYGRVSPRPPDPEVVGDRWRDMWMERLEATPFLLERWLHHQRRDAYWKHGSVCEDFGAIQCPVFAIGGWNDGYQNAIPRLLEGLSVPRIGVIGAWSHTYGFRGGPGPTVGVLQEFLRWWDHWLKEEDTGIMSEPMLRAYMQESTRPAAWIETWPGRWIAEPVWPVADGGIAMSSLALNGGGVLARAAEPGNRAMTVRSPLNTGFASSGEWCRHDTGTDLATDQRQDDAGSLCFDGEPLTERLEMLGAPVARLSFSVDKPVAQVAVRLNDVAPDGAVTRITWGVKNLCQIESQEEPQALEPGRTYEVSFKLNDVGYAVLPGHRLRLAISTSYFPMVWPSPEPVTLSLMPGTSSIALPLRKARPDDAKVTFDEAEEGPQCNVTELEPASMKQTASFDAETGFWELTVVADDGRKRIEDIDLEIGAWRREIWRIHPDDPATASGDITYDFSSMRGNWTIRHNSRSTMKLTKTDYVIHADLDAFENGERLFARSVSRTVKRDHT